MDFYDQWIKTLKHTEIIRSRVKSLSINDETPMPYIFLAESGINHGDTVVRRGEVSIQKPSLLLPPNMPQFDGFEFEENRQTLPDSITNFFLVRGVSLPSYHYNNNTSKIDVFEGRLTKAIAYYKDDLQRRENVHTGLIAGPEDCWQFSVLLYNCTQVAKNAGQDIRRMIDEFRD